MHERTLLVAAHPDDIEAMMGYETVEHAPEAVAFVASDGEKTTVNNLPDPTFCQKKGRRNESELGLVELGVPLDRQHYAGLPDGKCDQYEPEIADQITGLVEVFNIGRLVTLGARGYDDHTDHIATHRAAVRAKRKLAAQGTPVTLFALDRHGKGEHIVSATPSLRRKKLAAMACHPSQFAIAHSESPRPNAIEIGGFSIDSRFWASFSVYHALIMQSETYLKM